MRSKPIGARMIRRVRSFVSTKPPSSRSKETCAPIAMQKGRARRVDYEYERNGTASPFMIFAPLEGKHDAIVTDHPTAMDYAQTLKHISDTVFPDAEKIPSVTHKPAALYQAFPPQEARRL